MNCAGKYSSQQSSSIYIEFRFWKSLKQERFKSNLEFRYHSIILSIKFRKGFAKFMKLLALFKKFLS